MAIETARLAGRIHELSMIEDRDRIARDLHDTVIQRLFAVGLSLQGATRLASRDGLVERVSRAVEEIDETIRQIRSSIFELEGPVHDNQLRRGVLDLAQEMSGIAGTDIAVHFEGPVDLTVPTHVGDQMLATAREALTNVARHSRATTVSVSVVVDGDLCLTVVDNGVGLGDDAPTAGHGMRNMRSRAEKLGGTFEVRSTDPGTEILWRVPL